MKKAAFSIGPTAVPQLHRLRSALAEFGSAAVYRQLNLGAEQRRLLAFLEDVSPKASPETLSDTKRWLIRRGLHRPTYFSKNWRVDLEKRGVAGVALLVYNVLESGTRRQRAKFRAVEFGSRTSFWEARAEKWWKLRGRWLVQEEELVYKHEATPPARVLSKAEEYIQTTLVTQVQARLDKHVTNFLNRA